MLSLFVSSFFLGLIFNATPGAVFGESLRRGMKGGFYDALAVQVGSLVGDITWAVLGLMGVAALFTMSWVKVPLSLAGVLLLAWMSWSALKAAFGPMPALELQADKLDRSAIVAGAGLSLSTPTNIVYWTAMGGAVSALGVSDSNMRAFTVFLSGFMASSVVWALLFSAVVAYVRNASSAAVFRNLNLACAAGLAFFAVKIGIEIFV
ncbi:MAG TPA: LysE family transporter [Steroidobacter sp.]|uniref:LysE family transporter n=1 Tax=Steroidobacter sp. TaxID=1978227 RepID=UPI002EDB3C7A